MVAIKILKILADTDNDSRLASFEIIQGLDYQSKRLTHYTARLLSMLKRLLTAHLLQEFCLYLTMGCG